MIVDFALSSMSRLQVFLARPVYNCYSPSSTTRRRTVQTLPPRQAPFVRVHALDIARGGKWISKVDPCCVFPLRKAKGERGRNQKAELFLPADDASDLSYMAQQSVA